MVSENFFFQKWPQIIFSDFSSQQKMIILKKNLAKIVFFSKFDFFVKKWNLVGKKFSEFYHFQNFHFKIIFFVLKSPESANVPEPTVTQIPIISPKLPLDTICGDLEGPEFKRLKSILGRDPWTFFTVR